MHLRAFSHDNNVRFSHHYDWQISAFDDKAGTDDALYKVRLQVINQAAKFNANDPHGFV